MLQALTVSACSWAWVYPGSSRPCTRWWRSSPVCCCLPHYWFPSVSLSSSCNARSVSLRVKHSSMHQGFTSQHAPGSFHLSCNRGRLPSNHQCHSNFTERTLARMHNFAKKRMLCLYNRYVVSLLKAVRQHHCFGLIYIFSCVIIVSVYIIYNMVLMMKLSYKICIHKIKCRK